MYRLFTLGLFVLLSTIIQPVLSLPVQGPSLFRRTLDAHRMTAKEYPGQNHVHGKDTYTSIVHHPVAQPPANTEHQAKTAYIQAGQVAQRNGYQIGPQHDPSFIMAALHVPPDANHPHHTTYFGSNPKGAGNAHYKAHPEEVHAGDHNFMHAETHALALAHADGRQPGPGSYMAVYGHVQTRNGGVYGPTKLAPCNTYGDKSCKDVLRSHQIGFGQR